MVVGPVSSSGFPPSEPESSCVGHHQLVVIILHLKMFQIYQMASTPLWELSANGSFAKVRVLTHKGGGHIWPFLDALMPQRFFTVNDFRTF